jgi:CRP/FNR family transcriptional regulator, cyclic AMP receptor protein
MRIPKAEIVSVIHAQPAFAEMFIAYLLARNTRAEEDLVDQLFNSSEKRLARTLLILANFGKEGPPDPVLAKISQETLAEMIGATRSRVSAFMNKFRRLGLIETRRSALSDHGPPSVRQLLTLAIRRGT